MKRLIRIVLLITSLMLVGTAWFWLVEEWSLLDSVYMTVITLSTVGYGETRPLTEPGQAFVIVFLSADYRRVQHGERGHGRN